MKHEWRKKEKDLYLPKNRPEVVDIPQMKFFTISGEGNPNDPLFGELTATLYALSYAIKMSYKKGLEPEGFYDYTVYPLEGIWDLSAEGRLKDSFSKDDLVFKIMIRQPDFVDEPYARSTIERTKEKKPGDHYDKVVFETITEGKCVQMMHLGPYDDEPASFAKMEAFAEAEGLTRQSKMHREIYLSDPRKTAPEKMKTVLRFRV